MSKYKEYAVVCSQEQIATDIYSLWIQTEEIARAEEQIRAEHLGKTRSGNYLFNYLDEDTARRMEDVRLGKDEVKKWN